MPPTLIWLAMTASLSGRREIGDPPQAERLVGIIAAVTRGLNATIGEGLAIESEQFARMALTADLREGFASWIGCRPD